MCNAAVLATSAGQSFCDSWRYNSICVAFACERLFVLTLKPFFPFSFTQYFSVVFLLFSIKRVGSLVEASRAISSCETELTCLVLIIRKFCFSKQAEYSSLEFVLLENVLCLGKSRFLVSTFFFWVLKQWCYLPFGVIFVYISIKSKLIVVTEIHLQSYTEKNLFLFRIFSDICALDWITVLLHLAIFNCSYIREIIIAQIKPLHWCLPHNELSVWKMITGT